MSIPYLPPEAPLESPAKHSVYSDEFRREKRAVRPLGVVVVVILYFVFSAISAAALMIEGDYWWIVYMVSTGILAYLFRRLWYGDDKRRKFAVLFGFFVAALAGLGSPEGDIQSWTISDITTLAEGGYWLLAAGYLVYVRDHPFFETPHAT